MIKICKQYGKEFDVSKSKINRGRGIYCSKECQSKGAMKKIDVICTLCGKIMVHTQVLKKP